ncbi:hypothetical protein [Candidatus Sodalis pierantonius]|uniref:hypothetical protein n=1 Tax=Candidatus Sodalis pierantonii TaxID=1486991 RepID=UPI00046D3DD5|nr:hypothetical protein [Candidatus Sodalis pierantonius]
MLVTKSAWLRRAMMRCLLLTGMWGGNHFWTLKGNDGLAGSPLLARLTVILLILDSSQKNERKMIFLHYILDWIGRGLSKFESRLNSF